MTYWQRLQGPMRWRVDGLRQILIEGGGVAGIASAWCWSALLCLRYLPGRRGRRRTKDMRH